MFCYLGVFKGLAPYHKGTCRLVYSMACHSKLDKNAYKRGSLEFG
ncbi:hypothetical protein ACQJ6T_07950 [Helicobacter pylori]